MWRKDKIDLDLESNSGLEVTKQGNLVIESVNKQDEGLYSCVAHNIAGQKESSGAHLRVTGEYHDGNKRNSFDKIYICQF